MGGAVLMPSRAINDAAQRQAREKGRQADMKYSPFDTLVGVWVGELQTYDLQGRWKETDKTTETIRWLNCEKTLMHFSNTVGQRKGPHEDYDVTFTVLGNTLVGNDKQNTYYKGYTLPGNAFLFQLKNNDKANPKGEHFAMYNTQYFVSETERRIVGPYLLIDSDRVPALPHEVSFQTFTRTSPVSPP
jgi:hypothetical protein